MNQQTANPGWYRDPTGRAEFRYHDGTAWTEHVSTAGVVSTAPIAPVTSPAQSTAPTATATATPTPSTSWTAAGKPRRKIWLIVGGAALGLLLIVVVLALAVGQTGGTSTADVDGFAVLNDWSGQNVDCFGNNITPDQECSDETAFCDNVQGLSSQYPDVFDSGEVSDGKALTDITWALMDYAGSGYVSGPFAETDAIDTLVDNFAQAHVTGNYSDYDKGATADAISGLAKLTGQVCRPSRFDQFSQ